MADRPAARLPRRAGIVTPRRAVAALAAAGVLALSLPDGALHTASRVAMWTVVGVGVAWALLTGSTLWALARLALRDARAAKWTTEDDRRLREWADG